MSARIHIMIYRMIDLLILFSQSLSTYLERRQEASLELPSEYKYTHTTNAIRILWQPDLVSPDL